MQDKLYTKSIDPVNQYTINVGAYAEAIKRFYIAASSSTEFNNAEKLAQFRLCVYDALNNNNLSSNIYSFVDGLCPNPEADALLELLLHRKIDRRAFVFKKGALKGQLVSKSITINYLATFDNDKFSDYECETDIDSSSDISEEEEDDERDDYDDY